MDTPIGEVDLPVPFRVFVYRGGCRGWIRDNSGFFFDASGDGVSKGS